jgi:predicted ATPase
MIAMPTIKQITLKGFKSIKELTDFKLGNLNVLIGANGAGKSNFISFFHLLSELISGRLQTYVIKQGTANSLLHYGLKRTKEIQSCLDFGSAIYQFVLEPEVTGGLIFSHEAGHWENGRFSFNSPVAHTESRLIATLAGQPDRETLAPMVETVQGCRCHHFHDTTETAGIKQPGQLNDNRFLRQDASNLAAFLRALQQTHPIRYARIRETIQLAAPFFDDFILEPLADNPNLNRLEWRQKDSDYPFLAHQISDGTLRFMALTVLLLQPNPPPVIILDEPELGLHPVAIDLLASLIYEAALHNQVIIATQSPALISHFEPEEITVVDRIDGASRFNRLEKEPLSEWLEDYTLGELVQKNVIEAGPRYE